VPNGAIIAEFNGFMIKLLILLVNAAANDILATRYLAGKPATIRSYWGNRYQTGGDSPQPDLAVVTTPGNSKIWPAG
jgi:hypothetical protein